jgi:DNA-binding PadR family transcriptional regulator
MPLERYIFDPPFRLVDTLILASLRRSPKHGYVLEAHVTNVSLGRVLPGHATVYKALKRLAKDELIIPLESEPSDRRRYYDITRKGKAQLGRDLALLRRVLEAFDLNL